MVCILVEFHCIKKKIPVSYHLKWTLHNIHSSFALFPPLSAHIISTHFLHWKKKITQQLSKIMYFIIVFLYIQKLKCIVGHHFKNWGWTMTNNNTSAKHVFHSHDTRWPRYTFLKICHTERMQKHQKTYFYK